MVPETVQLMVDVAGLCSSAPALEVTRPAGIAVSGSSLYVAGTENGHAVVRSYALNATGAPTLSALK